MKVLTLTAEIPLSSDFARVVTWQAVGPISNIQRPEDQETNERFLRAIGRGLKDAGFAVTLTRTVETREDVPL